MNESCQGITDPMEDIQATQHVVTMKIKCVNTCKTFRRVLVQSKDLLSVTLLGT